MNDFFVGGIVFEPLSNLSINQSSDNDNVQCVNQIRNVNVTQSDLSFPLLGPPPDNSERPKGAEIFLGRLPPTVFEDELVPLLETFGKIWEVRILLNEKSEFGRGFAFATFYDSNVARAVVRNLTNKPLPGHDGVNFSISLSKPHSLVMIKNLPKHKSRAQITRDFEGFFEGMLGVNIWGIEGKPPVLWASLVSGHVFHFPLRLHFSFSASVILSLTPPPPISNRFGKLWCQNAPLDDLSKVKIVYGRKSQNSRSYDGFCDRSVNQSINRQTLRCKCKWPANTGQVNAWLINWLIDWSLIFDSMIIDWLIDLVKKGETLGWIFSFFNSIAAKFLINKAF